MKISQFKINYYSLRAPSVKLPTLGQKLHFELSHILPPNKIFYLFYS